MTAELVKKVTYLGTYFGEFAYLNSSCIGKKLTNRMWFSVVWTLIDIDTRHHCGQNVVDSRGAAERVSKLTSLGRARAALKKKFCRLEIHATRQRARADNSTFCYRKKQIDVSF